MSQNGGSVCKFFAKLSPKESRGKMNLISFELSLIAMVPGLFLCGYIFFKDRIEREPVGLLALLFGAGFLAYLPSHYVCGFVVGGIDRLFNKYMVFSPEGILSFTTRGAEMLHGILCSFLGFALMQISVKWLALYFITHRSRHFNYLFDGIVYSVFLSVGYALAENLHFALQNDTELLLPKLLSSVPCHLFVGIIMGYCYTMWRVRFIANGIENNMIRSGIVKEDRVRSSAVWLITSIALPFGLMGFYLFAGSYRNDIVSFIFYTLVFTLYGFSFVLADRLAVKDGSSKRYLFRLIAKEHTEVSSEDVERYVSEGLEEAEEDLK